MGIIIAIAAIAVVVAILVQNANAQQGSQYSLQAIKDELVGSVLYWDDEYAEVLDARVEGDGIIIDVVFNDSDKVYGYSAERFFERFAEAQIEG